MKKYNNDKIIKGLIYFSFILIFFSCNPSKNNQKNLEKYRQLRVEKLNMSRPLIHNNDGDDHLYPLKNRKFNQANTPVENTAEDYPEFSVEDFLDIRSAGLIGSDVSTLSYCTSRSFGLFIHNTKVGESYTQDFYMPERKNIVSELIKLGTDPLEATCKFAHENGFEFFWSNRMNDTHDAAHRPEKPHAQWNSFKEEHPEYLFGSIGERLPHGRWSAVDFSHPEIRDLCVKFFTEVCGNYDVDGIELDFFRHLHLFKNVARGEVATEEQLEMLTGMVTRIREMTKMVGIKKGKPILVLARVPDSFEYCRRVGIDLEDWMKSGLIDIVVGSGYFRLNPWDHLVKEGHKYGIKVYAGMSEPRIRKEHPLLNRNQDAVYRARAAAAWEAGVDGIYSFNQFNTGSQYFREIGTPEKLKNTNNLYFVTYRNGNPNAYLKSGDQFTNIPILTPVNPVSLEVETSDFTVEIGDENNLADVFIILYAKNVVDTDLEVKINDFDAALKNSTEDGLMIYEVSNNAINAGKNILKVKIADGQLGKGSMPTLLDAAVFFYRNTDEQNIFEF